MKTNTLSLPASNPGYLQELSKNFKAFMKWLMVP
ncbi:MAG: hypothetical protein RL172_79 [Bacteroidota bacterium]